MTPSEKLKMPVIGEIKTKHLKVEWTKENGDKHIQHYASEICEVIAETETTYTMNRWYKEHKSIPSMIPKAQVEMFIKKGQ
jgi:hypothetical protein